MVSIDDRLNQIIRELIGNGITLEQAVEAFEGKYIVAAMSASRGNVTQASKALGVHRNTLHNKLRTQTMLNGFAESIRPARRRISVHPDGYGTIFGGGEDQPDIYIDRRGMKGAMNGDLVVVRVDRKNPQFQKLRQRRLIVGEVSRVLRRAHRTVVGRFHDDPN